MPYSFDVDWENRIVRCRLHGHVTDEDLKGFYVNARKLNSRLQPRAGVIDASAAAPFEASPAMIRNLAKSESAAPDANFPRIVIAPSSDAYGTARMFEIQGEHLHPNLYVVRTEQEAWAILAVQNPRFEPIDTE